SDLFGRRAVYVLDVALFAVGSLLVVIAPTFAIMLGGRAIQGLGAGGIFPVASAVIGDTFPPEKRGSALGLIGAVFGLAFIIGPLIGGVLLTFSWHWLFLINLPIALALIVASLRLLPTTRPATRKPFDLAGMIVLAGLLATLTYGLNRIDTANLYASLTSATLLSYALAVPVLLAIFIALERRAQDPLIRLALFTSRQVSLALLFAFGAGLGEASMVFVPKWLKSAFGVSAATASFMLLPLVLGMAVGSPLAGRMLDRIGSRMVLLGGNALLAVGMFIWGFLTTNLTFFYGGAVFVGAALGILLGAPLRYIMLNEAATGERASAQGALTLFTSTGQLLGAALIGVVITAQSGAVAGYDNAYFLIGILAAVLALLALLLKQRGAEMAAQRSRSTEIGPAATIPPVVNHS
ncbi:MAG: MFS transporter, partial [Chloroflexota bacterium]|nr:MFS transporter [Chloroflexota bacterium]